MSWLTALAAAAAWAAPASAQAPRCAPAEVPVTVTYYSTVRESDFGSEATEPASWTMHGSTIAHVSRFARGFTRRDSVDPRHPALSGVAMEGAGLIDISLHPDDPALLDAWNAGYRVLTLETWDGARGQAAFSLSRRPLAATGSELDDRSTAVRAGNALFSTGDVVEVRCPGQPELPGQAVARVVDDECSSCEKDAHLDLYVPPEQALDGDGFSCCARVERRAPRR